MSDFDRYALEAAARIKDSDSSVQIVVMTVGPEQARDVVKHSLSVSADKAYLITDPAFSGSDAMATSYIIAEAIKKIEDLEGRIDAIFFGKQAIDGETAQVGPGVAEKLGYPQVTCCVGVSAADGRMIAEKEVKGGIERVSVSVPCILTFAKPEWEPRFSTIKRKLAANKAVIPVLSANDIPSIDKNRVGPAGSKVKIKHTLVPEKKSGALMINEETPEESAAELFKKLSRANII